MAHADPASQPRFSDRLVASIEAARDSLRRKDPNDAAHRCRVALKRARALARLARTAAPDAARAFNAQARAVMASLSGARDTAAMADAARLVAAGARPTAKAALGRVAQRLEQDATQSAPQALMAVDAQIARLLIRAKAFPPVSDEELVEGAAALRRRAERAFAKAYGRTGAERRHAWRKRHKDVQVAAKMLGAAWAGVVRPASAAALNQILGAERDLLLLEERLAHDPALAGGARAAAKARHTVRLARRVLGAHADRIGARVYR